MQHRTIGNSGLRVSFVGLGCNNFGRNVDRDTARGVFDVFVGLARSRHTAVVIVTHDPELAARCDRVLRLQEGRLALA